MRRLGVAAALGAGAGCCLAIWWWTGSKTDWDPRDTPPRSGVEHRAPGVPAAGPESAPSGEHTGPGMTAEQRREWEAQWEARRKAWYDSPHGKQSAEVHAATERRLRAERLALEEQARLEREARLRARSEQDLKQIRSIFAEGDLSTVSRRTNEFALQAPFHSSCYELLRSMARDLTLDDRPTWVSQLLATDESEETTGVFLGILEASQDTGRRYVAAASLAGKTGIALERLNQILLREDDRHVRAEVERLLRHQIDWARDPRAGFDLIAEYVARAGDLVAQRRAVDLIPYANERYAPLLLRLAEVGGPGDAECAIRTRTMEKLLPLANRGHASAAEAVERMLADEAADVRAATARTIGSYLHRSPPALRERFVAALRRIAASPSDEEARTAAREGLEQFDRAEKTLAARESARPGSK